MNFFPGFSKGLPTRFAPRTINAIETLQGNIGSEITCLVSLMRNISLEICEPFLLGASMFFRNLTQISILLELDAVNLCNIWVLGLACLL